MIESIFSLAGAKLVSGNYDGWSPKSSSNLVNLVENNTNIFFDRDPEVKTIHAGLECGIIEVNILIWI